jgi:hypothetical protein
VGIPLPKVDFPESQEKHLLLVSVHCLLVRGHSVCPVSLCMQSDPVEVFPDDDDPEEVDEDVKDDEGKDASMVRSGAVRTGPENGLKRLRPK